MRRIRRRRWHASTRRASPAWCSIPAASRAPIGPAFARAAPSSSSSSPGPTTTPRKAPRRRTIPRSCAPSRPRTSRPGSTSCPGRKDARRCAGCRNTRAYVLEQWRQGTFGDFWKKVGIYAEGFYDTFPGNSGRAACRAGTMPMFARPSTTTKASRAAASARSRLIMGPWLHGNRNSTFAGDVEFGEQAHHRRQRHAELVRIPAALVRPLAEGQSRTASTASRAVRLFLMGGGTGRRTEAGRLDHGGRWIEATALAVAGDRVQALLPPCRRPPRRRAARADARGR